MEQTADQRALGAAATAAHRIKAGKDVTERQVSAAFYDAADPPGVLYRLACLALDPDDLAAPGAAISFLRATLPDYYWATDSLGGSLVRPDLESIRDPARKGAMRADMVAASELGVPRGLLWATFVARRKALVNVVTRIGRP